MASGREIKTKIKSVQNTRKVTRALEMVSASTIRKAQDRMKASRPYARAMKQVVGHLAQANSEFHHPYLEERKEIKRIGYVIVSSDRGHSFTEATGVRPAHFGFAVAAHVQAATTVQAAGFLCAVVRLRLDIAAQRDQEQPAQRGTHVRL